MVLQRAVVSVVGCEHNGFVTAQYDRAIRCQEVEETTRGTAEKGE